MAPFVASNTLTVQIIDKERHFHVDIREEEKTIYRRKLFDESCNQPFHAKTTHIQTLRSFFFTQWSFRLWTKKRRKYIVMYLKWKEIINIILCMIKEIQIQVYSNRKHDYNLWSYYSNRMNIVKQSLIKSMDGFSQKHCILTKKMMSCKAYKRQT